MTSTAASFLSQFGEQKLVNSSSSTEVSPADAIAGKDYVSQDPVTSAVCIGSSSKEEDQTFVHMPNTNT